MKILIIGLGSIGKRHAQNCRTLYPNAQIVALIRSNEPCSFCLTHQIEVCDDLDRAMNTSWDLVVLATPSSTHLKYLQRIIPAGFNLLVEKPVVTGLECCAETFDLLHDAPHAIRSSAFNFRYLKSLQRIKSTLDNGKLGRVVRANLVAGLWLPDWRPAQNYRSGYSASYDMGGGVVYDLVHEIDVARWFFGEIIPEGSLVGKLSSLEIDAPDTAICLFSGPDNGPYISISLDYVSRKRIRRYEIVGELGSIFWNLDGTLSLVTTDGETVISNDKNDFDVNQTYVDMMTLLFSCINENKTHPELQTIEDGLKSSKLAAQAQENWRAQ